MMATEIFININGHILNIHGNVPDYLFGFSGWNFTESPIFHCSSDLNSGETIIDVGANIGIISCSLAAQRPDLHVIAIEPLPSNAECLRRNVSANNLHNITVMNAAVSDRPGTVRMGGYGPWGLVREDGDVEVPAIQLDQLEPLKPSLIKIDVEGWEPYVLAGGANLLKTCSPKIFMEWNTWTLLLAHHDPISFASAIWDNFDIMEQYHRDRNVNIPTQKRDIVHDSITKYNAVTDLVMRLKDGHDLPPLRDMISAPTR